MKTEEDNMTEEAIGKQNKRTKESNKVKIRREASSQDSGEADSALPITHS